MDILNADFLNSSWLIKMLEKSSKEPQARLLNVFDILDDWLDAPTVAPNIAEQLNIASNNLAETQQLQTFLSVEAAKAGAAEPEMLANQLYYMAIAAVQNKLNSGNQTSLTQAKVAASALINAQTKKELPFEKLKLPQNATYVAAAGFVAVCVVSAGLFYAHLQQHNIETATNQQFAKQVPIQSVIPQMVAAEVIADPQQTAALMAQIEQMRHGNCQLIEAIQLPDSQKGIYLNMVVNGQVSTDPSEQAIALDLLRKTRCNYTPMLMANSTG